MDLHEVRVVAAFSQDSAEHCLNRPRGKRSMLGDLDSLCSVILCYNTLWDVMEGSGTQPL
jgi:hypothetical protein